MGGAAGAASGFNQVSNNYLKHTEIEKLRVELEGCASRASAVACRGEVTTKYAELSKKNDAELRAICTATPSSEACQTGIKEVMNYTGDTSWKSYSVMFASFPVSSDIVLNEMDGDIIRSRNEMLGFIINNRSLYDAVDTIEARADFFGALYMQNGAVWLKAAEETSRDVLQGFAFKAGDIYTGLVPWRDEAGKVIMATGYEEFKYLYNNPTIDRDAWSIARLKNEQNNEDLQKVHEKYVPNFKWPTQFLMEERGKVKDIMNPKERIITGCKNMETFQDVINGNNFYNYFDWNITYPFAFGFGNVFVFFNKITFY